MIATGASAKVAVSADNGATWSTAVRFSAKGPDAVATSIVALGSQALAYFLDTVFTGASPFTSWTANPITGIRGGQTIDPTKIINTSAGLAASDSAGALIYSTDGIAWAYATPV